MTSKTKQHLVYEKTPHLCVADALQIARIPGTTDSLGEKYSNAELQSFGRSVVHYLALYGLVVVPRADLP